MPSLPSSTNNENVRCGNSCADSITEAEKSRILEQVLHRQIILGVESIFSSILAGRNPKNISFHHVLNRIMMILQLQVNFAVFKKTKENLLQLMYLSNTDYKHRQKIGKYVQDTLQQKGQNIAINDTVKVWKELDELIYPILGSKTDYFLGVLKCEKLRSGSYEFEWVYKIENIVDVQNGWDCAGYKLARILDFENYKHTGELFLSSIKTALDRYINPLTDDQECFDKTNYTRNSESFWLDICNQDGRLKKEVLQSFNQLKDNFYTRLITDYTGGYGIIGKSVVDNIYNKAVPNINVVGNNSDLSNFFFITRSYSHKNYRRYERKITDETTGKKLTESYYDYNVRVAIPRSQRNDFKNFFCNLLSNKNNESTKNNSGIQLYSESIKLSCKNKFLSLKEDKTNKSLFDTPADISSYINNIENVVDICISTMQRIYESGGEKNIDLMIDIIGREFTIHTKSIADGVFKDGVSYYRDPFRHDLGLGRSSLTALDVCKAAPEKILFSDHLKTHQSFQKYIENILNCNEKDQKIFDFFRAFLCRVLFEGMATKEDDKNSSLYIMMNPIEVGAKVFGVMTYLTRSRDPDAKFETYQDIEFFNRYWLQNYHVSESINNRFKRNIRTDVEKQYLESITYVYHNLLREMVETERKYFDINKLYLQLKTLSLFYPYGFFIIDVSHDICPDNGYNILPNNDHTDIVRFLPYASIKIYRQKSDNPLKNEIRYSPFSIITGYEHSDDYQFVAFADIAMSLSNGAIHLLFQRSFLNKKQTLQTPEDT